MTKYCPKCGKEVHNDFCSNCGHTLVKMGDLSVVHSYEPSSATAYTKPYNDLVDKFRDDIEDKKTKDELIDGKLDDVVLDSFLRWGYLNYSGGTYNLTDFGKEAYYKNLKFRELKPKKKKKSKE